MLKTLLTGLVVVNAAGKGDGNKKGHAVIDYSYVESGRKCPSDKLQDERLAQDPHAAKRARDLEDYTEKFKNYMKTGNGRKLLQGGVQVTIPVYFHVFESSGGAISVTKLQEQVDVINEDFRASNTELSAPFPSNFNNQFQSVVADLGFQFTWSPGDVWRKTDSTCFGSNDAIKKTSQGGHDYVPGYLNIWTASCLGNLLGYAQFPGGPVSTDGVVIAANSFANPGYQYGLGRTLTHEIGHWINLRHIWGDGACNQDDFVSDTPLDNGANYGCPSSVTRSGCNDNVNGGNAMTMNYMDYTDDACMYMFTEGQKTRALAAITQYRSEYLGAGCAVTIPGCFSYSADCNTCLSCKPGFVEIGQQCVECNCPASGACQDNPQGWYDSDGPTYNCAWYSSGTNCAAYGNSYANFGATANQACCTCGGGLTEPLEACSAPAQCSVWCGADCSAEPTAAQPTDSPTTAQPTVSPTTAQPTPEPTPEPTNSPSTAEPTPEPTAPQPTNACTPRGSACTGPGFTSCCQGYCRTGGGKKGRCW